MNPSVKSKEYYKERSLRLAQLLKEAYALSGHADNHLNIMIVDDSFTKRQAIIHRLASQPVHIFDFNNGKEAVEAFKQFAFHLLLIDLDMPVMDGFKVCEQIRSLKGGKTIPIIITATQTTKSNIVQSRKVGADDFLAKPISKEVLIEKIRENIEKYNISWPQ